MARREPTADDFRRALLRGNAMLHGIAPAMVEHYVEERMARRRPTPKRQGMDLQTKLASAEAKQRELLSRMNTIDAELSAMTPADPRRVALKHEKDDLLPRYRGAKQHVANLRRAVNSAPVRAAYDSALDPSLQASLHADDEPSATMGELVEDIDVDAMQAKLYAALANLLDQIHDADDRAPPSASVRVDVARDDIEALEDFANWYEHEHPDANDER